MKKVSVFAFSICILISLSSCNILKFISKPSTHPPDVSSTLPVTDSEPSVDAEQSSSESMSPAVTATVKDDTGFSAFWRQFRAAVLANNFEKLKSMTQFPLETRGLYDSDPYISISEDQFADMFSSYLNEFSGMNLTDTVYDYIKRYKNAELSWLGNTSASVSSMEFKKVDDQWKLTFIYTEVVVDNEISEGITEGQTPLTRDELDFFTDYFEQETNNGFLLSGYSEPSDINLAELFYNGAGIAYSESEMSADEINDYLKATNLPEVEFDLLKVIKSEAEAFLLEKTGVTFSDLHVPGLYLEKYDAFYWQVSDTNYNLLICDSGYKTEDGKFVIHCSAEEGIGQLVESCTVTLKKDGGHYLFVSNSIVTMY